MVDITITYDPAVDPYIEAVSDRGRALIAEMYGGGCIGVTVSSVSTACDLHRYFAERGLVVRTISRDSRAHMVDEYLPGDDPDLWPFEGYPYGRV